MKVFTIDGDGNIVAHESVEQAQALEGTEGFSNAEELGALAADWPTSRLVEVWNGLPGVTPVKKFKDRKTALIRLWSAIRSLGEPAKKPTVAAHKPRVAPVKGKSANTASQKKQPNKARQKSSAARNGSKTAKIMALLERPQGASLDEIIKATKWQAHSVRGFVSAVLGKRMGVEVRSSRRDDGARVYSLSN